MSVLLKDIHSQLMYFPRAIVLMVLVIPAYLFIRDNDKSQIRNKFFSVIKQPWLVLFLLYLSFILISTLFIRWPRVPYNNVLSDFGLYNASGLNKECIENTMLFIPYTFLFLQAMKPSRTWKSSIALALGTTTFVELSQLIFWLGEFQLSDLVHNTIGGIIGCALWHIKEALLYK